MKTRALLLALPLLAAACRDNRASIEVQCVCATTDDCTFSATCDAQAMDPPYVDASLTGRLWLPIQVSNQLPNNANLSTGRLNTNDAHVDELVMEYQGIALGSTVVFTNQYVPASGSSVIGVDLIPAVLNAQTALQSFGSTPVPREIIVNLRLRGYLDDGSRFETGEFPIGVQVCSGCLGACPTGTTLTCPGNLGQWPRSCT